MNANPTVSAFASLIERIASAVVGLDEDTQARLRELDGQTLVFELSAPSASLRVSFVDGGLRVNAETGHNPDPPNTIVRGPTLELLQGLVSGKLGGGISIDGDEALLAALQDGLRQLRPDLSAIIEPIAQQGALTDLVGQAEYAFASLQAAAGNLFADVQNAGKRHFADEDDLELFATRLQNLQLKLDRLAARTEVLKRQGDTR